MHCVDTMHHRSLVHWLAVRHVHVAMLLQQRHYSPLTRMHALLLIIDRIIVHIRVHASAARVCDTS